MTKKNYLIPAPKTSKKLWWSASEYTNQEGEVQRRFICKYKVNTGCPAVLRGIAKKSEAEEKRGTNDVSHVKYVYEGEHNHSAEPTREELENLRVRYEKEKEVLGDRRGKVKNYKRPKNAYEEGSRKSSKGERIRNESDIEFSTDSDSSDTDDESEILGEKQRTRKKGRPTLLKSYEKLDSEEDEPEEMEEIENHPFQITNQGQNSNLSSLNVTPLPKKKKKGPTALTNLPIGKRPAEKRPTKGVKTLASGVREKIKEKSKRKRDEELRKKENGPKKISLRVEKEEPDVKYQLFDFIPKPDFEDPVIKCLEFISPEDWKKVKGQTMTTVDDAFIYFYKEFESRQKSEYNLSHRPIFDPVTLEIEKDLEEDFLMDLQFSIPEGAIGTDEFIAPFCSGFYEYSLDN
jgi:hypothetical protein